MKLSVANKVGISVFFTTWIVGTFAAYLGYQATRIRMSQVFREKAQAQAEMSVSQLGAQVDHYVEAAQILKKENFPSHEARKKFLWALLNSDSALMGVTLWDHHYLIKGKWAPVVQMNRPDADVDYQNFRYPLDLKLIAGGKTQFVAAQSKTNRPLVRLGVPVFGKIPGSISYLLSYEIDPGILQKRIHLASDSFSFILDQRGHLITQASPERYSYNEDLSWLPVFKASQNSDSLQGQEDFRDTPHGKYRFGGYSRHPDLGITAIAEVPYLTLVQSLTGSAIPLILGSLAASVLASLVSIFFTFGWISLRLARMRRIFAKMGNGQIPMSVPGRHGKDEFGETSQGLQRLCESLRKKHSIEGPMAKFARIQDPEVRAKLESGKLSYLGEKTEAAVLHCHLHGFEMLVAKGNAKKLIELLNIFNQAVSEAVETNFGIVDHIHEGSIVAFWGVPISGTKDVSNAIQVTLKIREYVRDLNESLAKMKLDPVKLGMGLHHGTVVVGQVGAKDRMEYTAIGQPLEVASRIHSFCDQLGTDMLVTEQAVNKVQEILPFEKVSAGDETTPTLFELQSVFMESGDPDIESELLEIEKENLKTA